MSTASSQTQITQQAKQELSSILRSSLVESLNSRSADAQWNVEYCDSFEKIPEEEFILLSISSYSFRIAVVLHFTNNESTQSFVANQLNINNNALTSKDYYDYLGEVGNIFCGVVKRELGYSHRHLGMSTPNTMGSSSLSYLTDIGFISGAHLKASSSGDTQFYGSILVWSTEGYEFDLTRSNPSESDTSSGELELF